MKKYNYQDIVEQAKSQANSIILILDGVEDPRNLGAILRTAEAVGVAGVIIPNKKAVSVTDVVRKTSTGAADIVPVAIVPNLVGVIKELKKENFWVTAVENGAGKIIYDVDFKGHTVLVLGSEGFGISRLIKETCDFVAGIPMHGQMTSLNVSVATGIALFEVRRQWLN